MFNYEGKSQVTSGLESGADFHSTNDSVHK